MINLGDITKISGYNAPIVDVVIGGSPCQDLSIAGKRAGLAGERSGLYMEQIRIIKEMRERDKTAGRTDRFVRPRYMVWENVPGAFSSNHGKDFAAVLEEAVRVVEPEAPHVPVPEKGWPTSGCLMGDGWSVAWRVLDAQFWGVPQRRRRIALVADFGGHTAPEILFVRESVSGDSETGREKGKRFAGDAENGVRAAVDGVKCLTQWDCQSKRVFDPSGSMSTYQAMGDGGANNVAVCYSFDALASNSMKSANPHSGCREVEVNKTLDTTDPNPSKNQGGIAIVQPTLCLNEQGGSVMSVPEDLEGTLRAQEHGHQPAICIQGNCIDRADTAGCNGKGWRDDDVSFTLNTIDRPAVYAMSSKQQSLDVTQDVSNTICANDYKEPKVVYDARGNGDGTGECSIVRRLTPLECERLQGFPCGWTDIGDWVDSKGKKRKTTDSARYKALGNSIALPPWKWVLKRLSAQYERDATMASLFDGIGGFPLIWEQLNGRGSCLWASEIDEFPIAVTRQRFREEK